LSRFGCGTILCLGPAIRAPRRAAANRFSVSSLENLVSSMAKRPIAYFRDSKGNKYPFKEHSKSSLKRAFRPYATKLGILVFLWNQLHDNLSHLFQIVVNAANWPNLPYKIWFALESDALQRKILRDALEVNQNFTQERREDIKYLLTEIEHHLRPRRNDAIHAPLMMNTGLVSKAVRTWAEANIWSFSPRSASLRNKDLIREFDDCIELTEDLIDFSARMILHLRSHDGSYPWPQRPPPPHAQREKNVRDRRRRAKLPPHLRGSSQT
jgi:hypothetical protein